MNGSFICSPGSPCNPNIVRSEFFITYHSSVKRVIMNYGHSSIVSSDSWTKVKVCSCVTLECYGARNNPTMKYIVWECGKWCMFCGCLADLATCVVDKGHFHSCCTGLGTLGRVC